MDEKKASSSITMLATGLWVIVGSLLAYGVVMTAIKAVQLFS
mgnify:CR=1 FL=1